MHSSKKYVALVVGGTGVAACEIVPLILNEYKEKFQDVMVIALDAEEDTFRKRTIHNYIPLKSANLNSKDSLSQALKNANSKITHVFWFLDANKPPHIAVKPYRGAIQAVKMAQSAYHGLLSVSPVSLKEKIYGTIAYLAGSGKQPRNILWLQNIFDALKEVNAPLQRFILGTGGKHYGMHFGPNLWDGYSTPFHEDSTKGPGPLSYFEMENFIKQKASELDFGWNVIRPTFIIGITPKPTPVTQSFGLCLGVYAGLLKAMGKPLIFPGNKGNWACKNQLATSNKIAEVAVWSGINEECKNQAFNVTSCPEFSWSDGTWDEVARYFGMEPSRPVKSIVGLDAASVLGSEAEKVWNHIITGVGQESLLLPFNQVFNYDFFDKSFSPTWDAVFSEEKLIDFGFPQSQIHEFDKASKILISFMDQLVNEGYIPDAKKIKHGMCKA